MAIVVEDGTIVPGANSYVDLAGLRAFAALRGLTVTSDDVKAEGNLIQAMDYLEGLTYNGRRVAFDQPLQFPRTVLYLDDFLFPYNQIPPNLINAQCQLAIIAETVPLFTVMATGAKGAVMSESVYGAVSRTYAKPSSATTLAPYLGPIYNFLRGLTRASFGSAFNIRT